MAIVVSVIDDDERSRRILAGWIQRAPGFQLDGSWGDAESALAALPQKQRDVVLMDINLPGMSGVEAVRQLKPQLPSTQFIMLTVYEDPAHIFKALAAGATGYLLKQTPREELLNAMAEVHRGGSPMSGGIARKVVQSFREADTKSALSEKLSAREYEVLDLLARGYLCKEIAHKIGIANTTVDTYLRRIYEKLQVNSRAQAVARYAQLAPEGRAQPF